MTLGQFIFDLPGLLEAIFSDSFGVRKRTGSLGGLVPLMLMDCTWTIYSVSASKSHNAQERVVVFTSWIKRIMRTSFFWNKEDRQRDMWEAQALQKYVMKNVTKQYLQYQNQSLVLSRGLNQIVHLKINIGPHRPWLLFKWYRYFVLIFGQNLLQCMVQ